MTIADQQKRIEQVLANAPPGAKFAPITMTTETMAISGEAARAIWNTLVDGGANKSEILMVIAVLISIAQRLEPKIATDDVIEFTLRNFRHTFQEAFKPT